MNGVVPATATDVRNQRRERSSCVMVQNSLLGCWQVVNNIESRRFGEGPYLVSFARTQDRKQGKTSLLNVT